MSTQPMLRIICDRCDYSVTDAWGGDPAAARACMADFGWAFLDGLNNPADIGDPPDPEPDDVCPECLAQLGRLPRVPLDRLAAGRLAVKVLVRATPDGAWHKAHTTYDGKVRVESASGPAAEHDPAAFDAIIFYNSWK